MIRWLSMPLRWSLPLLFTALLAALPAQAQVTVQTGSKLQIPEPGATAAVSLDTRVASATIVNKRLIIAGISPGGVGWVALNP